MKVNLHTHTYRCHHAQGTDREFVEAAIAAGYDAIGFSDHCPWPYKGFVSGIRMAASDMDGYFASMDALRKEFSGKIKILAGFEAENVPSLNAERDELYAKYPVDYLILGQHFLDMEWSGIWSVHLTQDEARLEKYVDRCIDGLDSGRYLYLAHPDVIHYDGDEAIYRRHMARLCECMKRRGTPVEINLLGLGDHRHYPSPRFLRLAAEFGLSATIAVDAHQPDALLDHALRARGEELCASLGLPVVQPALP